MRRARLVLSAQYPLGPEKKDGDGFGFEFFISANGCGDRWICGVAWRSLELSDRLNQHCDEDRQHRCIEKHRPILFSHRGSEVMRRARLVLSAQYPLGPEKKEVDGFGFGFFITANGCGDAAIDAWSMWFGARRWFRRSEAR